MNFPQLLIAISENFQKRGQPRYPDFRLFFPEVLFISILNFAPGISRIFRLNDSHFGNSTAFGISVSEVWRPLFGIYLMPVCHIVAHHFTHYFCGKNDVMAKLTRGSLRIQIPG